MSDLSIVVPSEGGTGSEWGLSYWLSFMRCRRKYLLDQLHNSAGSAASVGTLYHKLKEHYYNGDLTGEVALEYQEGPEDEDWQEALRLFGGFASRFSNEEFTEVLGCEIPIEFGSWEDEAEKKDCLNLFGVPILTGQIDMAVEIDEACAARLAEGPAPLLIEPGRYLLDTKSKKVKTKDIAFKTQHSFQAIAYQTIWNIMRPEEPVKGMIFDFAIRHKTLQDYSFMRVLVPPPSKHDLEVLRHLLGMCYDIRQRFGEDFANPMECFGWGVCFHLTNGTCERI